MMPDLSLAVSHFEETMQFQIVSKTVNDGDIAETSKVKPDLWFEGTLEPMPERALLVKPEGQRNFKWWMLWTDLKLQNDTVIKDENSIIYRVMKTSDWNQAGYYSYQLIEGPGL
jgi:hypothetical protein